MKGIYASDTRVVEIPSRGVCQVRVEIPAEDYVKAVAAFHGKTVMIQEYKNDKIRFGMVDSQEEKPKPEPESKRKKTLTNAQQCAIMTQQREYKMFIEDVHGDFLQMNELDSWTKNHLEITSKTELNDADDSILQVRYQKLLADFREYVNAH